MGSEDTGPLLRSLSFLLMSKLSSMHSGGLKSHTGERSDRYRKTCRWKGNERRHTEADWGDRAAGGGCSSFWPEENLSTQLKLEKILYWLPDFFCLLAGWILHLVPLEMAQQLVLCIFGEILRESSKLHLQIDFIDWIQTITLFFFLLDRLWHCSAESINCYNC